MNDQAKTYEIDGVRMRLDERSAKEFSSQIAKLSQPPPLAAIVEADQNGLLVWFQPTPGLSWDFIFFIQNLMLHQRLSLMDELARKEGLIV